MPREPRDYVVGDYVPVINKRTKEQVEHPEKGRLWRIRAELPRRGHKQKRPRKYRDVYGSERKVKAEMQQFVAELNQDLNLNFIPTDIDVSRSNLTFGAFLEMWLEANKSKSLKRRTWECYVGYAQNHLIPCLGHVPLAKITPFHISRYKDMKLGANGKVNGGRLNPATVNKHLSLIRNVLEDAASPEKRLIPHNPALLVKRLKGGGDSKKAAVVNCLTLEQLNDLLYRLSQLYSLRMLPRADKEKPEIVQKLQWLGYTEKEIKSPKALFRFRAVMLYPLVYIGTRTGMRLSELLALKWKDIDFTAGVIRVYESSHYGRKEDGEKSSHHINCTKEGEPKSFIELSRKDIEFLKQYRKNQQKQRLRYKGEYTDRDLVFAGQNGSYLRNETVSGEFTDFARANGFSVTFHGLRHTHCTLLIANGVPLMYVARRVGHRKSSTTSNFYSHADKTDGINLGDMFNNILEGKKEFSSEQLHKAQQQVARIVGVG